MSGIIAFISIITSIVFLFMSNFEAAKISMMFASMMMLVQINYNICTLAKVIHGVNKK